MRNFRRLKSDSSTERERMVSATWVTASASCADPESRGPISSGEMRQLAPRPIARHRGVANARGALAGCRPAGAPESAAAALHSGEVAETPARRTAAARSASLCAT